MACLRFYHHFMLSLKKKQMKAVLYSLVYFSEVELVRIFWKPASHPGSSSDIWKTLLNHHRREKTIWNKNPFNPLVQHWRSGLRGAWSGLGALCVHAIARDVEQAGKNALQQIPALIEHFCKIFLDIGQRPASNLKVLQLHVQVLMLLFLWSSSFWWITRLPGRWMKNKSNQIMRDMWLEQAQTGE